MTFRNGDIVDVDTTITDTRGRALPRPWRGEVVGALNLGATQGLYIAPLAGGPQRFVHRMELVEHAGGEDAQTGAAFAPVLEAVESDVADAVSRLVHALETLDQAKDAIAALRGASE